MIPGGDTFCKLAQLSNGLSQLTFLSYSAAIRFLSSSYNAAYPVSTEPLSRENLHIPTLIGRFIRDRVLYKHETMITSYAQMTSQALHPRYIQRCAI
jgi:hypothetical protein